MTHASIVATSKNIHILLNLINLSMYKIAIPKLNFCSKIMSQTTENSLQILKNYSENTLNF